MTHDPRRPFRPPLEAEVREALDSWLGATANPETDRALLGRVRSRVMDAVRGPRGWLTVPESDAGWETLAPGVSRKVLRASDGSQSSLVRLDAGASFGSHAHEKDEECIVLEGTLRIGPEIFLRKGDYHVALKGSTHGVATTDTGALVFLRGACQSA